MKSRPTKPLERRQKAFCRKVARRLPIGGRRKRSFLSQIRRSVGDYLANHPWADEAEIREQFGSPEELAVSFVSEMTYGEINRAFRIRRRIFLMTAAVAVTALLLLGAAVWQMISENRNEVQGYYEIITPEGAQAP